MLLAEIPKIYSLHLLLLPPPPLSTSRQMRFPFFQSFIYGQLALCQKLQHHSRTYPHIHTHMLLYLQHCFKNGFLQSKQNVNTGTRKKEGEGKKKGKETRNPNCTFHWLTHSVYNQLTCLCIVDSSLVFLTFILH